MAAPISDGLPDIAQWCARRAAAAREGLDRVLDHIIEVNPHVFATIVALSESALAVALIFGIFTNMAAFGGVLLTLTIWSTAEGFGGPYKEGSTDIGTAIIYAFVFVALFLAQAGLQFGADRFLTPLLGRWGWLASGRVMPKGRPAAT